MLSNSLRMSAISLCSPLKPVAGRGDFASNTSIEADARAAQLAVPSSDIANGRFITPIDDGSLIVLAFPCLMSAAATTPRTLTWKVFLWRESEGPAEPPTTTNSGRVLPSRQYDRQLVAKGTATVTGNVGQQAFVTGGVFLPSGGIGSNAIRWADTITIANDFGLPPANTRVYGNQMQMLVVDPLIASLLEVSLSRENQADFVGAMPMYAVATGV